MLDDVVVVPAEAASAELCCCGNETNAAAVEDEKKMVEKISVDSSVVTKKEGAVTAAMAVRHSTAELAMVRDLV